MPRQLTAAMAKARYDYAVKRGARFIERVQLWRAYEAVLATEMAKPVARA